MAPDGALYVSERAGDRIRRVEPALPGFTGDELVIASRDGSEVYVFDGSGRHLRTLDALTGTLRRAFTYDEAGLLLTITDGYGNVATFERDAQGAPRSGSAPPWRWTSTGTSRR